MEFTEINKAISDLWFKRIYRHNGQNIVVACLLRSEDIKPLKAPWWKGKEICLIGTDINGNFLLRHCDGSVRYWNHAEQKDEILAPSLRDFINAITE